MTVRILDCTLREGMQAPGVAFTAAQSEEIAAVLVACGVDMIECGHPGASDDERARIKATIAGAGATPVLVHARACRGDVEAAIRCGVEWIGIFLGFNEHSRRTRVTGTSTDDLLGMARDAISFATQSGLHVRFTVEDASRTERALLEQAYAAALGAGATRLCFADTVGALEPHEVHDTTTWLRRAFPDAELELHLHDDRGLAVANALAGVDAGAHWLSCSVNGLGERAGIADLFTVLANLHHRKARPLLNPSALRRGTELVAAFARTPVDPLRAVSGRNAFSHTARLHQRAVDVDPMAYSWIDPAELGATTTLSRPRRWTVDDLVVEPEVRSATELRYHRHGPGDRYLLIDERKLDGCGQYCIVRHIPGGDPGPGHVDAHRHNVDSLFVFLGNEAGLTGLQVEVTLGDEVRVLDSPTSVFIPAGIRHSYRVLGGAGLFLNSVLAGTYDQSLLE